MNFSSFPEQQHTFVPMHHFSDDPVSNNTETSSQENSRTAHDTSDALAALQHPEISAAINAAIIGVLQKYSQKRSLSAMQPPPENELTKLTIVKPVVKNNLFVITVIWTILGLFILFAGVQNKGNFEVEIAIFTIYGIVQVALAVFTLLVTSSQAKQVYKRGITLAFLIQGWMALVLSFAGTYLFFQNAYTIGLVQLSSLEQAVRAAASVHLRISHASRCY
jgi:hypothetical protein